jgi:CheY-like chemotaxis protein
MPPDSSFREASCWARRKRKTQAIPILAVTGKAMPEDQQKCLANGCDGYIAKPFTFEQLKGAIEALLKAPQAIMRRPGSASAKTR